MVMRATFTYDGRPIRLFAVHTVAPFGSQRRQWIEGLQAVGSAVAAERRPVLLAGDFNATWGHRSFRELLDLGLTDAAAARGHAFQMTWPGDTRLPAFARIDHVMTTRELITTRISTGVGRGSDHRPLIADVAFPVP
jgi:endonuclease/exonuclease/phosphatase (EEP) superfamily protein YafD